MVHNYIEENFVSGKDYGQADPRCPKPVLLKPGAEKVCKLFNTRPRWTFDRDTWEMLGKPDGTICYKCEIVDNSTGEVIGEGRGAEKVGNKSRDANKAIKIAEKCSIVDAALYTFGLSEKFTQDEIPKQNDLNMAKQELQARVANLRAGCSSSMSDNNFLHAVSMDFLHESPPKTIGALNKLSKAIEDRMYDLETGERIPE
jgi:hypothetical protein